MSNSSSLCGYSSRSRAFTASRAWRVTEQKGRFKSLRVKIQKIPMYFVKSAGLTLTNGKAGPGAKGSFSCSIWYLRYSSTPFCSNTFCSRSVRNKTREETAMVTAFSGFGCKKNQNTTRFVNRNNRKVKVRDRWWPTEVASGKQRGRRHGRYERNGWASN